MGQTYIIENYAEHPYEFPQGVVVDDKGTVKASRHLHSAIFPWRIRVGEPSRVRISEETYKLMMADKAAAGWFGDGQLRVGKEPATKDEQDKIPTQPGPPKSKFDTKATSKEAAQKA